MTFDEEASLVGGKLQGGFRLAVIGSTSFWHEETQQTCEEIGERLAGVEGTLLLTGGVAGVGEAIGRAYCRGSRRLHREPSVIHVVPRGSGAWDYGTMLFAGNDMCERREILGRLGEVFVVLEGGPGTEHEARVAAANNAVLVPVGRSGGHADMLYRKTSRASFIGSRAWKALGAPEAAPATVAAAVVEIVESCIQHAE